MNNVLEKGTQNGTPLWSCLHHALSSLVPSDFPAFCHSPFLNAVLQSNPSSMCISFLAKSGFTGEFHFYSLKISLSQFCDFERGIPQSFLTALQLSLIFAIGEHKIYYCLEYTYSYMS